MHLAPKTIDSDNRAVGSFLATSYSFLRVASYFQLHDRIKNVRREERDEDHSEGLS